jgi:hypothetical protein
MQVHSLFCRAISNCLIAAAMLAWAGNSAAPVWANAGAPPLPSVAEQVAALKPGEFLWVPQVAPQGPLIIVVSLSLQRAYVYRNGVLIGVTTVSTGVKGRETPTGVFTILQKEIDHKSNLYDDAPMPFMQRLTWDGVAMHAGKLPGYPASHGCIRLPAEFAKLLYGVTGRGMTVVITDDAPIPRVAPSPAMLQARGADEPDAFAGEGSSTRWQPELAPTGPLSIIISGADGRLVVLRNGVEIGSAPVRIEGGIAVPAAYVLRAVDAGGRQWLRVSLPWDSAGTAGELTRTERDRINLPDAFRDVLLAALTPGTTVVATPDTLRSGSTGAPITVLTDEK